MKKTILFSLFLILINTMGWAGVNNIIILKTEFTNKTELDSLSAILTRKANSIKIIDIKDLESRILDRASVVIYHRSDSAGISTQEINLKKELLRYVKNGGSLLLTMDGVRLMNEWNIEPEPLQIEYQDATDSGNGRAVGFHGYREHPVYDGLYGGAYTWKATVDHFARTIGFSDTKVPRAAGSKVIGINWAYIQYHENRKLVWETPVGKGRILSIGGYLYFSRPNVNRAVCDIFINNCIGYLSGKKSETPQKNWQYDTITTARVPFESLKITAKTEPIWNPVTSPIEHSRMGAKDNFWNVSGQQLLAMGKEPGGIDEIWIHPLMALRDLTVGVKYKGSNDIVWLNNLIPTVIKRPESFERIYTLNDGTTLREYIVASLTDPLLVVRYDWENKNVDRIFVCYTSNLRLMWPYSLESTGTLFFSQSNDGSVAYLFDKAKQLNMVTAFDRSPLTYKSGECDFKNKNIGQFNTIKAKHKQVSFLYEFSGDDKSLNFYLSGGEMGLEQSAHLINQNMGSVEKLNEKANSYFNSFDKNLLSISSSDSLFNEAYRWALISTDKFYCYTPSLGSSLMSGYFTTARGWNGGHEVSGRPGYAWYFGRDTELSSMALSSIGDFRKVREILRTFGKYQAPEGKIYHELTTSGSVHYDASDATPLYVALAGYYLKRSGDIEFIRQEWDKIAKAMDFCYSTDTDGDLLIE
ncbi:MAG: amylo-alpha-1,6-glucosidase, partial [Bacteroidales bacterium]|nr:amylo-alpha-1,6-glucosidase [Bacteroidales bacterium]